MEGLACDRSLEVAMLALQGPAWTAALEPHLATPAALSLDYFEVGEDVVAGVPCLIARTGYTGEPGVELMCPWDGAPAVWDALMGGDDSDAEASTRSFPARRALSPCFLSSVCT